jgi:hypothetical protein
MRESLGTETLKTGEQLHIERVLAPDAEREGHILPLLGHKPPHYMAHLKGAFADTCDSLETRFYGGILDGQVVGNIMTVEANGVGILGHVYTVESQRRKGICQAIMRHQMDDFRNRNGHVLLLGTGYQSAAYWIYHSFGFRDLPGGHPGLMRYLRADEPDFLTRFFTPASGHPVPARWRHWPLVALLASLPDLPYLRSLTFGAWGVNLMEGPYCRFRHQWGDDPRANAAVLETETGAVAGIATLVPEGRWPGLLLLDVFAHPQTAPADVASLIRALRSQPGKTVCYAEPQDALKITVLEQSGFRREAILPGQFSKDEQWQDVWLYSRRSGE